MEIYVYGKHLTITGIFTCVEDCGMCECESMGAIFTCVFGEVCMGVWVYRSCVWQKCCEYKRLPVWNSGMSWLTWHWQTWQAYQHQPNSLGSTHFYTCNSHSFPWPSLCLAHCWNHLSCGCAQIPTATTGSIHYEQSILSKFSPSFPQTWTPIHVSNIT